MISRSYPNLNSVTIKNLKPIKTKQNNYKWLNRKQEYKCGIKSPEKFRMALSSTTVMNMIKNCKQRIEAGLIESAGKIIQKIFHEAADLSLEKKEIKNYLSKRRF